MLFNSFEFFIFLAGVLALYYCLGRRAQNVLLLGASYLFYGCWDWRFLGLLAVSTLVDYNVGKFIDATDDRRRRKALLFVSIFVNLGILGFFKYYNFFADGLTTLLATAGLSVSPFTLKIILPVGISFYTLQTLGYTIDVYRRKIPPCRSIIDFSLFVSFFPQLVAGPIERASHLIPQIQKDRTVDYRMIRRGCFLILFGLFQKMVIADNLALVVDRAFENPGALSSYELIAGVYAFSFQIYCDFAGYSNIAIGTASLLGIDIMQNFNLPYFADRISDFWRRWHISLSTWLRDYLYISLGGSRTGSLSFNLMATMVVVGLWHGASWNMLLWGAIHGMYLVIDKKHHAVFTAGRAKEGKKSIAGMILTFHLVAFSWIFFRAPTLADANAYISSIVYGWGSFSLDMLSATALAISALMLFFDYVQSRAGEVHFYSEWGTLRRAALYSFLFLTLVFLGGVNVEPFIYFIF